MSEPSHSLFDHVPVALYRATPDGRIVYGNPALLTLLGLETLRAVNMADFFVDPQVAESWKTQIAQPGVMMNFEAQFRRYDTGEIFWVKNSGCAVPGADGQIAFYEGALENITEHKQADASLQAQRDLLRKVLDLNPAQIFIRDQAGRYTLVNRALADFYHTTIDDLVGKTDLDFDSDPEDAARFLRLDHEIMEALQPCEIEDTAKDPAGQLHWFQEYFLPLADPDGIARHLLGIASDITRLKDAEKTLAEQRDLLRKVIDLNPNPIFIRDRAGRFLLANQALADFYHTTVDDLIGKTDLDFDPNVEEVEHFLQTDRAIMDSRQPFEREDTGMDAAGQSHWFQVNKLPLLNEDGTADRILGIAIDITRLKKTELALRKANRAYRTLSQCNHALVRATDEVAFLQGLCRLLVETDEYRMAWFGYYVRQDDIEVVYPMAQAANVPLSGPIRPVIEQAPLRAVILTGTPQVVDVTSSDPAHADWCADMVRQGHTASVLMPLCADGELLGVLCVYTARPTPPDAEEIDLLKELADDAAFGIISLRTRAERGRVEESEHEQRVLAEALCDTAAVVNSTLDFDSVLKYVLDQVGRIAPHDGANIQIIGDDNLARTLVFRGYDAFGIDAATVQAWSFPVNEMPTLRKMRETHSPCVVPDTRKYAEWVDTAGGHPIRSYLGAPIIAEDQVIGFLNLDSMTPGFFSPRQAARLQAFADQVALAIQNARLYHQLRSHSAHLEETVARRTAELRATKEQVETILNHSPDAILLLGTDGAIKQINPATCDLFDYCADDLVGQPLTFLLDPDHAGRCETALAYVLIRQQPHRLELLARRRDRAALDVDVALAPVQDGSGIVCNLRDVTALKEVERIKDAFVSNVSHELRTPITSLKLYCDLLRMKPDRFEQYLEALEREVDRQKRIIENILQLSRLDQHRVKMTLAPVDLIQLARQYVEDRAILAESRLIDLHFHAASDLLTVLGDEGLLGQALSVLLINALDYTPAGGQVTVTATTRWLENHLWIGLMVSDTGPGIPPDEQRRLFERFFRGSAGRASGIVGTGLGLSIAKEIMMRHQGRIEIQSSGVPGEGTTFGLWLPADALTPPQTAR
jgi:PAS domain S-box-containing protein